MPVEAADGTILAHAARSGSRVLKKGQRLGPAELALLRSAGIATVTVAELDPGDVPEDAAAGRVAAALLGSDVTIAPAATGRANLIAARAGLVAFDGAAVDRLNAVSEAVTLATLPPLAPVEAGRMVATVKIIPFAVPRDTLERCVAAGASARIRVLPFRPLTARLIHTVNSGLKPGIMAKTAAVTAARMSRLGGALAGEDSCPHEIAALTDALRAALRQGCDLLLVIGASAIVDRRDVIPAAIEAVGGAVERLGMPVDPGNLILVGRIAAVPILGLPGCARSSARNGLDWVLERIASGTPVGHAEIGAMGVGGLLIGREEEKDYF